MRYSYGTTPLQRRFTGQTLDSATGLYDYGARYYDPVIARFIQPDTIVPDAGDPQAFNRCSYLYNNPMILKLRCSISAVPQQSRGKYA